jgi:hypothetical protein
VIHSVLNLCLNLSKEGMKVTYVGDENCWQLLIRFTMKGRFFSVKSLRIVERGESGKVLGHM